jgi:hypothetical protein
MLVYKIDLVYLWVDGADPMWQAKKEAALEGTQKKYSASSVRSTRWSNYDELLYSLRSVAKFAPWINHIFIVTDNQKPQWLNIENSKISIIDHTEIIPSEKLPLFNSNAIEMFLWKIPNLTEHFLYANDDMFFGKGVKPDFFFTKNGNPIVIMKERSRSFNNQTNHAQVNHRLFSIKTARTIKFVYQQLGSKFHVTFKHAIEPIRKSYMAENFMKLEKNLMETTITPFRDVNNLQRIIMPLYDNFYGRNTIVLNWRTGKRRIVYQYRRDSIFKRFRRELLRISVTLIGLVKYDCYDKQLNLIRNVKKYKPTSFAINDFNSKKSAFKQASDFMELLFPSKSEFEK